MPATMRPSESPYYDYGAAPVDTSAYFDYGAAPVDAVSDITAATPRKIARGEFPATPPKALSTSSGQALPAQEQRMARNTIATTTGNIQTLPPWAAMAIIAGLLFLVLKK